MKTNLLAISVGNTRTRVGVFVEDELIETDALENSDTARVCQVIQQAYAPLRNHDNASVLLASTNPAISDSLARQIQQSTGKEVWRVGKDLPIPVGLQLDPETIVGEDRLLNAAAAYDVLKQACVVVDAGTAMTVDFVDGAGTFHGGAICAGGQMMLDALAKRAAQLPELELYQPDSPIGHNTGQAMLSGAFYGIRGMVRELVERFAEQVGAFPLVVATGGDASLVLREFELIDRVVPELTLMGMALTVRVAQQQEDN